MKLRQIPNILKFQSHSKSPFCFLHGISYLISTLVLILLSLVLQLVLTSLKNKPYLRVYVGLHFGVLGQ